MASLRFMSALAIIFLFFGGTTAIWGNNNGYGGGYSSGQNSDAVLLEGIRALTLEQGKYTNARRVSAIPQLQCVGGSAKGRTEYFPTVVQCTNVGGDGSGDVQWKCEADLDSSVRFGRTDVSCEGYSHPDDPYVLKGSCGLEYTLELTEAGRQKANQGSYGGYSAGHYDNYNTPSRSSGGFSLGKILMYGVIAFLVFNIIKQCTRNPRANAAPGGAPSAPGYGPGFGGPNDGYDDNDGYGRGNSQDGYQGYPKTSNMGGSSYAAPPQQNNRPGFWSGMMGGGGLGYLLGRATRPRGYGTGYGYGGYGGGYRPSSGFGGGFGGSSGGGSTTRTSSGFGGTRKR
eukprot:TRINITY_DN7691_c0_g1_i1.p1 TRINITY_DN7691_c0_g1~~TRINITY_DN7691_c0_g1_i1.p1  ORF type:complete len:342 (-),score=38.07 TRINITY_DN7691_c0_g1_i1:38-1063(-)